MAVTTTNTRTEPDGMASRAAGSTYPHPTARVERGANPPPGFVDVHKEETWQ